MPLHVPAVPVGDDDVDVEVGVPVEPPVPPQDTPLGQSVMV